MNHANFFSGYSTILNIRLKSFFCLSGYGTAATFVRQLSAEEKQKLISLLQKEGPFLFEEPTMTHFASEKTLAKDWLSPEEDEAWRDL